MTDVQGAFETAIQEDLKMIDITYDTIVHTSDHFDKIATFTEQLIKQGDMYMDNTDGETVRRAADSPFQHRSHSGQGAATS